MNTTLAKWLRCVGAIGIIVLLLAPARQAAAQSTTTDTKAWLGVAGKVGLYPRLRLDVEHQQRFSNEFGVEKSLTELEALFRAHDFLKLGLAYRTIATYDDGFWHRGSINIGVPYDVGRIGLSYRLRLQSTARSNETVSKIRNKFGVAYDLRGGITPSAAFELHYSTTNSEFREARLIMGVEKKLSKRIEIGAFYMFQNEFNKNNNENNHVVKVGMTYVFRKSKRSTSSSKAAKAAPIASNAL